MSVIEIINQKNSISLQFEEHKEEFVKAEEHIQDALLNLENDFGELLKLYNIENEDIAKMKGMVGTVADLCLLINFLINGNPKSVEDIYRQIYVINGKPIPFEYNYTEAESYEFTKEEIELLKTICLPYDIDEINEPKNSIEAYLQDVYYMQKLIRREKDENKKRILNNILDKFAKPVPEEDVKEIHMFFASGEMDRIFLDVAGVHEIVGKRSRLKFKNGKKIIGYVGSDFFDNEQNPCISIFESFDERKGFYDYNLYKLDDLYGVDTLYTNDLISFDELLPDEILDTSLTNLFIIYNIPVDILKTFLTNNQKMKVLDYIIDKKVKDPNAILSYCEEIK